jgi:hypothetical protein
MATLKEVLEDGPDPIYIGESSSSSWSWWPWKALNPICDLNTWGVLFVDRGVARKLPKVVAMLKQEAPETPWLQVLEAVSAMTAAYKSLQAGLLATKSAEFWCRDTSMKENLVRYSAGHARALVDFIDRLYTFA